MAKLYFRYGCVFAAKSAHLLDVRDNYTCQNKRTLLAKPSFDTRDGKDIVASKVRDLRVTVDFLIHPKDDFSALLNFKMEGATDVHCLLVDEAQFLSKVNVEALEDIAELAGIPVICYGLRADWRGELFEGSSALFAHADSIEEIKTVCWMPDCNRKALYNLRLPEETDPAKPAQSQELGNHFRPVCRSHYQ